jgi:hypothetical protein
LHVAVQEFLFISFISVSYLPRRGRTCVRDRQRLSERSPACEPIELVAVKLEGRSADAAIGSCKREYGGGVIHDRQPRECVGGLPTKELLLALRDVGKVRLGCCPIAFPNCGLIRGPRDARQDSDDGDRNYDVDQRKSLGLGPGFGRKTASP